MRKIRKIAKVGAGLSGVVMSLHLGVLPVFAADNFVTSNLCPSSSFGLKIPGCGGATVGVGQIISFGINLGLFIAFIAALGFLIFGGVRWITSGGDKEGTAKAKATVTAALIGLVVVLAAWVLINVVLQLLTGQTLGTLNVPNLLSS